MPYTLRQKNECFQVVAQDGNLMSKCSTKKKAEAQIRLLNFIHGQKQKK